MEIFLATLAGTSFMTLFSYLIAVCTGQPYKEPLLLAFLIDRLHLQSSISSKIAGWVLHYLIGLLFVLGYDCLLQYRPQVSSWEGTILYGCVIGLTGIISWAVLFSISKGKPKMNYFGYYLQLFIAHQVFAFTVSAVYDLLGD